MTISITNLQLRGSHGMYEEEQILQNNFLLNVEVRYVPDVEVIENIRNTINYVSVYELIKKQFNIPEKLLETLVMRMVSGIKSEFQQAQYISVEIKKLHPPIEKFIGNVGVKYDVNY